MLDLFAGCGGLSLGLSRADFEPVGAIEKDPVAASSYGHNLHGGCAEQVVARDITDAALTPGTICVDLQLGPVREAVDVVAAGPPCQAFARVGRAKLRALAQDPRAFLKDPRCDLHLRWIAWIRELQPLLVIIENVPDMLNLGGRNLAEEIARELEELGWRCGYTLLNAVHYGVPQLRERMFLLGWREELGISPSFPAPSHRIEELPRGYVGSRRVALRTVRMGELFSASGHYVEPPDPPCGAAPAVTAREAIGDLPVLCPARDPAARRGARRFDRAIPWPATEPSAYARGMREWPGFEAAPEGPYDHVVRHLPRDWPIFERMRSGDEYPPHCQRATICVT